MANDEPAPSWRNVAAWSAVAAILYLLVLWATTAFLHQDALDVIRLPTKATAVLGLALLLSMAVTGYSSRKRPLSLRTFRNYVILSAAAILVFLLALWGYSAAAGAGALRGMHASEGAAAVTGLILIGFAILGTLATASAHTNAGLIDDEVAAEELRERGRLFFYSYAWMLACGLLLVGLSLAGPGGLLPPAPALAGAVVLVAILIVLGIMIRRLNDELGHTLAREAGNVAFHLILLFGSGWAMLAHLGFIAGPAPLDWLTLLTVVMFAGSFVAVGRRKLLTR